MIKLTSPFAKSQTKQGVASLYVVIFATILFGVITLSFVRIILSEASQSSNDDLSQSAYDSALAGVEDAKIAVNRYYQCLSLNNGNASACDDLFGGDCKEFKLKKVLHKDLQDATEVKVQESNSGDSDNGTDQAYTCVLINDTVDDYRATLSSDTRSKVIPIGINSDMLKDVSTIRVSWYSDNNGTGTTFRFNDSNPDKFHNKESATVPPALSASLILTGSEINLDSFNTADDGNYSTMVFLPVKDDANGVNPVSELNESDIQNAGKASKGTADGTTPNSPFLVKCTHDGDFACNIDLKVKSMMANINGGNAFLVVALPYGDINTDVKVTLLGDNDQPVQFKGVQLSVDSTGRANQLYRRVETRLDPADSFFPYPEFEVDLGGNGNETLEKNFWITRNCWTETGTCDNNGTVNQ